jgi:hypothetical protein
MKTKCLAIGIILLFVGVTMAPTINFNTVKASTNDDLVEVTTQACGIKGYGNTSVKLIREQYQNLEQYLVDFRARLNQTSTREEAIPIFKDAVVELDKYGLLPRGMSAENELHFLRLINQAYNNLEKFNTFSKLSVAGYGFYNIFCYVIVRTTPEDIVEWGPLHYLLASPIYLWIVIALVFPEMTFLLSVLDGLTNISTKLIGILRTSPLKFWTSLWGANNELWSIGLKGYKHSEIISYNMYGFKGLRVILPTETYYIGHTLAIEG